MSLEQRAGQLLLLGVAAESVSAAEKAAIQTSHIGSVVLHNKRTNGTAGVAAETAAVQAMATESNTAGVRFFIAADQEGGRIQRLNGEGFSDIPTALTQGTYSPSLLQTKAETWGEELAAAGINLNLAPVMDVVPPGMDATNDPIGALKRGFGHDPETVGSHGAAVVRGMGRAGIATALKHFPGLGRVTENTDDAAGVVDSVTTADDPYLAPFQQGIDAGSPFVMISLASYPLIDPSDLAVFSSPIMEDLLRDRLGFHGIIVTDDMGGTVAVASVPAGERAVRFVSAGGEMIIVFGTRSARTMAAALVDTAEADPAFRALLDAATLHVLQTKEAYGLLACP
jgi:beta-N-acetylhexosaminidase